MPKGYMTFLEVRSCAVGLTDFRMIVLQLPLRAEGGEKSMHQKTWEKRGLR
jgi:hypothetical protein